MSEREIKASVYSIMYNSSLTNDEKYNRFVDLVLNAYQQGGKDERKCYESLFKGDYDGFGF